MADTYSKIYTYIIFAVKGRQNLISEKREDELYSYLTGIIKNKGQKLTRINGMSDHLHLLIGIKPEIALYHLVRDIKSNSSRFINEKRWINGNLNGNRDLEPSVLVIPNYIKNQKEHHKKTTFRKEYEKFLKAYGVEYKTQFLFTDPETRTLNLEP